MSKTPVPRRRYGRTEIQMPIFSTGGMRFQQSWERDEEDKVTQDNQANLAATLHRSIDLGFNHFETAWGYGTSEFQVGNALPEFKRDEIILQSKVMPREDMQQLEAELEDSFAKLGVDCLDLLSIHGINLDEHLDWALADGGCLDIVEKYRQAGKVKHIGFSSHGNPTLLLRAINSGRFDYINFHYYFFMQANEACLAAATAHDMGIFIISPNDKGGKLYEPSQKLLDICAPHHPMSFNALFCLLDPRIHTLSLGAAKPSDFDLHLKTIELLDAPETTDYVEKTGHKLTQAQIDYLGEDWYHNWSKGIPKIAETPGNINIHEIIRFWNLWKSLDMLAFGQMRYNILGFKNHWFPGNNALELSEGKLDENSLRQSLSKHMAPDLIIARLKEAHTAFYQAEKQEG